MYAHAHFAFRIAGSDTTSTTLSYFFWELSRRPDIAKKLHAEIDEAMADPRVIPDISVLQNLPYLDAFIKEGTSSTILNLVVCLRTTVQASAFTLRRQVFSNAWFQRLFPSSDPATNPSILWALLFLPEPSSPLRHGPCTATQLSFPHQTPFCPIAG